MAGSLRALLALWCVSALPWDLPAVHAADKPVQHIVGTVAAIDQKRLVVTTFKGQTISIKLTKQVRYKDKTDPQSNRPPAVGDRVIVEAVRDKKTLTAVTVHYSPTSQPAEPSG
ncbi:MAG: DUF5666 domain-containing protein [Nitrospira sp.]|nr:DUF5666 domain-containing protein [Nitrospira sp.]MCP9460687.1 DUF5666 domain-containing protein [Nitrospira sp.]MCP9474575.1 DUF5666 domain-containing protein [Nitrospira sp.]